MYSALRKAENSERFVISFVGESTTHLGLKDREAGDRGGLD